MPAGLMQIGLIETHVSPRMWVDTSPHFVRWGWCLLPHSATLEKVKKLWKRLIAVGEMQNVGGGRLVSSWRKPAATHGQHSV